LPVPPSGSGRLLAEVRFASVDRPAQRRPQVVELSLALLEPRRLRLARQLYLCLPSQVQEILTVTTTRAIKLALRQKGFLAELPDRVEHCEPWKTVRGVDWPNQR